MKRKITNILGLLMITLCLLVGYSVKSDASEVQPEQQETIVEYLYGKCVNELYTDPSCNVYQKEVYSLQDISYFAEAEVVYETDINAAAAEIRSVMEQRGQYYDLCFKGKDGSDAFLESLIKLAVAETGIPTQGDYIRWAYNWYGYEGVKMADEEGYYYYILTYEFSYYASAEQEAMVTQKVASVLNSLALHEKNEYQKIRAIYDYVCANVQYDYDTLYDDTYLQKYSAYAAAIEGKAVCQGYAVYLYRLLMEAGISSRVVHGTAAGDSHAWNIVYFNGIYYNLDSTWDAGCTKYSYFLTGKMDTYDHYLAVEYTYAEFGTKYPRAQYRYTRPEDSENYLKAVTGLAAEPYGTKRVLLTWNKSDWETGYIIYSSKNGEYKYLAMTSECQYMDEKALDNANNYYWVFPYRINEEGTRVIGEKSIAVSAAGVFTPDCIVRANAVGSKKVELRWNVAYGADGYIIYRKVGSTSSFKYLAMTSYSGYTDTTAYNYMYNFYRVYPYYVNSSGQRVLGPSSSYVYARPVSAVGNLKASNLVGGVKLSWEAAAGATGYMIYRRVGDGSFSYLTLTTSTGLMDMTASSEKYNFYRVYPYFKANANSERIRGESNAYVYGKAK